VTKHKTLRLHSKQGRALQSQATEILYGGAAGGGKSHLMRVAAIAWCFGIPGLQVYLFRRTSPDLLKNHMTGPSGLPAMLADWVAAGVVKINHSNGQITFDNGSTIHLCHCQYAKDIYNFQGAEIHVLMIDELTHWTEPMYAYLRGRVRLGGLQLPERFAGCFPRVLTGANPGGIGHNWVKAAFVDGAPPMEIRDMPEEDGGMRRQYIPAKLADNPTQEQAGYKARLRGLGSAELVRAMLDGDWDIVAGGMFDDVWDRERHVIKPFEIPASWRVDRAFDWGSSKPFSVGFWAESDGSEAILADGTKRTFPRGTLFRVGEWYGWTGKPNEGLKMSDSGIALDTKKRIADMGLADRMKPGPADSSIFDETNGDSPAKIQERHGVRWEKADKSPGSRKRGWQLLRGRLKAGLAERMEEPGLFVFDNCRQFIRTVPVLPRDERDPDDVDTDAEDHIGDETRYRVLANKPSAMTINLRSATRG
jgi:Terminase large subunit, T4likevirus-type, N-terminal